MTGFFRLVEHYRLTAEYAESPFAFLASFAVKFWVKFGDFTGSKKE